MEEIMKTLFSTAITNTGGRKGKSFAEDNSFSVNIAPPGSSVLDATNPEQLFAAGYSACFNSALDILKRQKKNYWRINSKSNLSFNGKSTI